jgi:hypothetical protein
MLSQKTNEMLTFVSHIFQSGNYICSGETIKETKQKKNENEINKRMTLVQYSGINQCNKIKKSTSIK